MPTERPVQTRLAASVLLTVGLASAVLVVLFRPEDLPWLPPCPWFTLTGLRCPGCGITRAVHELAHGEVLSALQLNPLAPLVPLMGLAALTYFTAALWTGRWPRVPQPSLGATWAAFGILTAFWLYRTVVDLWHGIVG